MSKSNNDFRNYSNDKNDSVANVYKKMLENQTLDYVLSEKEKHSTYPFIEKDIWEVIKKLDEIIDESDPDHTDPQSIHSYQTACFLEKQLQKNPKIRTLFTDESWNCLPKKIKKLYGEDKTILDYYYYINSWDWLPLIGFIHDLGKVLVLAEWCNYPQWSVVGDTFPVGVALSSQVVYSETCPHLQNIDSIYTKFCGFKNMHLSYGHDEYMATVLERNENDLPEEAIYIIRFHSFYPWHTPRYKDKMRGYARFASWQDWEMLPLLKLFQSADLYSKVPNEKIPSFDEIYDKFDGIIRTFFKDTKLLW